MNDQIAISREQRDALMRVLEEFFYALQGDYPNHIDELIKGYHSAQGEQLKADAIVMDAWLKSTGVDTPDYGRPAWLKATA